MGVVSVCEYSRTAKSDKFQDSLITLGLELTDDTLESVLLSPKEFARFNRPDSEKSNVELAEEIILIIQRSGERLGAKRRRMMMYDADPSTVGP